MVKPTPPLAIGVFGSGEGSPKMVESLLTDFTAPYPDVTLVLPVTDELYTPTVALAYGWATENDVPFVAVTTSEPVSKELQTVLDVAAEVTKVAKVGNKIVTMLEGEKAEGEVALLMAWDDEDRDGAVVATKSLSCGIRTYNLLDGLDEMTFDEDDETEAAAPEAEAPARAARPVADDYDDWGVRKLRAALRERADQHNIPDRLVGQLSKDDAIRALRNIDNGKGMDQPESEPEAESGKVAKGFIEEKAERTTRARRAFAEGASEGSGDEAQTLPNSRGSDVLQDQDEAPDTAPEADEDDLGDEDDQESTQAMPVSKDEAAFRHAALSLAIQSGLSGHEAVSAARTFELYLMGEKRGPGRPRADGTPARPREVDPETGKPVRRRYGRA